MTLSIVALVHVFWHPFRPVVAADCSASQPASDLLLVENGFHELDFGCASRENIPIKVRNNA